LFMAIGIERLVAERAQSANVKETFPIPAEDRLSLSRVRLGVYFGRASTFSIDCARRGQYSLAVGCRVRGKYTHDGKQSSRRECLGGARKKHWRSLLQNLPCLGFSQVLVASTTYCSPPFERRKGGLLGATGILSWLIAPRPSDTMRPRKLPTPRSGDLKSGPVSGDLGEDGRTGLARPFLQPRAAVAQPATPASTSASLMRGNPAGGGHSPPPRHQQVLEPLLQRLCAEDKEAASCLRNRP